MKALIIFSICCSLLTTGDVPNSNKLIKSINYEKDKHLTIRYTDYSLDTDYGSQEFKIKTKHKYKYIEFSDNKIYLNPDSYPSCTNKICGLITYNFEDTSKIYSHNPNVVLTFLIDSTGAIMEWGFQRQDIEKFYNIKTVEAIKNISERLIFKPATIDGEHVASFYTIVVFYSNLTCLENPKSKN